ncbi:MAG: M23 family metallopeptidase [Candidatus Woesearchaeota archaeon]
MKLRVMSSRKASPQFTFFVMIVAVLALFRAYVVITNKQFINREIGGKQSELFFTYQEGEKVLLYLDNSGRYAAEQTAYELALKGGYDISPCGVHEGYVLWTTKSKECFPEMEDIEQRFEDIFSKKLTDYTKLPNIGDVSNQYMLKFAQKQIVAMPSYELDIVAMPSDNFNPLKTYQLDLTVLRGKPISYKEQTIEANPQVIPQPLVPSPDISSDINAVLPIDISVINSMMSRSPPYNYGISSCFEDRYLEAQEDPRISRYHKGLDFPCAVGTEVRAFADGEIISANSNAGAYGVQMIIEHGFEGTEDKFYTVYGHLSRMIVNDGARVKAGDVIALSGNTGDSSGPHLHFELRLFANSGNNAFNPLCFDYGLFGRIKALDMAGTGYCQFAECEWYTGLKERFERIVQ